MGRRIPLSGRRPTAAVRGTSYQRPRRSPESASLAMRTSRCVRCSRSGCCQTTATRCDTACELPASSRREPSEVCQDTKGEMTMAKQKECYLVDRRGQAGRPRFLAVFTPKHYKQFSESFPSWVPQNPILARGAFLPGWHTSARNGLRVRHFVTEGNTYEVFSDDSARRI